MIIYQKLDEIGSHLMSIDYFSKVGWNELPQEDWEIFVDGKFCKDHSFIASINSCKNTTNDKIISVGYCHMKILVRTYITIPGHKRWL